MDHGFPRKENTNKVLRVSFYSQWYMVLNIIRNRDRERVDEYLDTIPDWNVGTGRSGEVQELLPDGSMAPEKDEVLKILPG